MARQRRKKVNEAAVRPAHAASQKKKKAAEYQRDQAVKPGQTKKESVDKFQQMLEYLVNEDQAKAEELFHEIVVEKSRNIYENLLAEEEDEVEESDDEDVEESDDEDVEEGYYAEADHEDEEEDDDAENESMYSENDDEEVDEADDEDVDENYYDEADDDMEMGGDPEGDLSMDMGGDEEGGDDMDMDMDAGDEEGGDTDDKIADLEAELADLKAEFEELMADEGGDEAGDDMDMGGEEGDDDMDMGDEEGEMGDEEGEMGDEEPEESFEEENDFRYENKSNQPKSAAEQMREYVEKISGPNWPGPGKMGDNGAYTKSPVAGKNDMGGTTANIVNAGTTSDTNVVGKGGKVQGNGHADQTPKDMNTGNVNVPGGKAAKVFYKNNGVGHGAEKKGKPEQADKAAGSPLNGAPKRAK
jgi:hypothetical protein